MASPLTSMPFLELFEDTSHNERCVERAAHVGDDGREQNVEERDEVFDLLSRLALLAFFVALHLTKRQLYI